MKYENMKTGLNIKILDPQGLVFFHINVFP